MSRTTNPAWQRDIANKMQIALISTDKKNEINQRLKSFGLQMSGGSIDKETGRPWVGIKKGGAATYNEARVARLLMGILETDSIVLDSKLHELN